MSLLKKFVSVSGIAVSMLNTGFTGIVFARLPFIVKGGFLACPYRNWEDQLSIDRRHCHMNQRAS